MNNGSSHKLQFHYQNNFPNKDTNSYLSFYDSVITCSAVSKRVAWASVTLLNI